MKLDIEKAKKIALYVLAGIGGLAIIITFIRIPFSAAPKNRFFAEPQRGLEKSISSYGENIGKSAGSDVFPDIETSNATNSEGELTERKVIKNGYLSLLVEKAEETAENIKEKAEQAGGFVEAVQIYEVEEGVKSGSITIRVPASRFNETMSAIKDLAIKVEKEQEDARDITEQLIDLEARLKNRKAEEEQYLEIMEKAETVEDILKVSSRLSTVRGNIERLEGQIKYLSEQVDMSSIRIYLTSEAEVEVFGIRWHPLLVIKKSLKGLINGLTTYVDSVIAFFFALPVIALWVGTVVAVVFFGFKLACFVWQKLFKKKKT